MAKKPKLEKDAPTAIVGFAGGGGVECGLIEAGIRPVVSIDKDPHRVNYSEKISHAHSYNFSDYGKLHTCTLQDWVKADFPDCPKQVDVAHFSPVCSNFSRANNGKETEKDIDSALAIAEFISRRKPLFLSLENVPGYLKSRSLWAIIKALKESHYLIQEFVINLSDYGIGQNRIRYFLVASRKSFSLSLKAMQTKKTSWFSVIGDRIPQLKLLPLTRNQEKALESAPEKEIPFIIPRVNYRGLPRIISANEPCPTITRSLFDDHKGGGRKKFWNIWDGQQSYQVDFESIRLLGTFPDWYAFPANIAIAGGIVGYAVPPKIISKIYRQLLCTI